MTFEYSQINKVQMNIMEYLTDPVKYLDIYQSYRIYVDEYNEDETVDMRFNGSNEPRGQI